MKRAGFTMIELIFVIVILGILAAVAVPKLAATRNDAQVAKSASAVSTAITDIGSYYTAQGVFGKMEDMTNVKFETGTAKGSADAKATDLTSGTIYFKDSIGTACLKFVGSPVDGNLTITSTSGTTTECKGIVGALKDAIKTHQFGGSSVKW